MTTLTIQVPDEVATALAQKGLNPARILAAVAIENSGRAEMWALLQRLAAGMAAEDVMELRPSEALNDRIDELTRKEQVGLMTPEETEELRLFDMVEHLVRMAKIDASGRDHAA